MAYLIQVGSDGQTESDYEYISGATMLEYYNAATATGTIGAININVENALSGCIVGAYEHISSNAFKCKDTVSIGSVSTGLQTFTGLDLSINSGEYIGIYASAGAVRTCHDSNHAEETIWGYFFSGNCTTVDTTYYGAGNHWMPNVYGHSCGAATVTTQAASSVASTTATGNGNITALGGATCSWRGIQWGSSSGSYGTTVEESGNFNTGAFTASLTGLPAGSTIYARARVINDDGYSYGNEINFLTKPAVPTNVAATDGTYTDKVTVTWSKSTGATGYRVYRDGSDISGLLGDVATYDDTGASAPTITGGTAAASDGTYTDKVALSISGQSANNGSSHTYKVVASNATGSSADSSTDTGYRGVGSLTYQWQRSAADSDASYSDISGATSASYNDTGAPADGSGRYYKCVLNATGASSATSSANRGYRIVPKTPHSMYYRRLRG